MKCTLDASTTITGMIHSTTTVIDYHTGAAITMFITMSCNSMCYVSVEEKPATSCRPNTNPEVTAGPVVFESQATPETGPWHALRRGLDPDMKVSSKLTHFFRRRQICPSRTRCDLKRSVVARDFPVGPGPLRSQNRGP